MIGYDSDYSVATPTPADVAICVNIVCVFFVCLTWPSCFTIKWSNNASTQVTKVC